MWEKRKWSAWLEEEGFYIGCGARDEEGGSLRRMRNFSPSSETVSLSVELTVLSLSCSKWGSEGRNGIGSLPLPQSTLSKMKWSATWAALFRWGEERRNISQKKCPLHWNTLERNDPWSFFLLGASSFSIFRGASSFLSFSEELLGASSFLTLLGFAEAPGMRTSASIHSFLFAGGEQGFVLLPFKKKFSFLFFGQEEMSESIWKAGTLTGVKSNCSNF